MTTRRQSGGEVRAGRASSFFVKLAIVMVAILVGLFIFEVFLRAVGYTYPIFYEPNSDLGYTLRPGMEGWYRKEGESYVVINSDGLRDSEHAKEKPPNTVRIAIVGDSYAEALQVEQEAAFWSVTEKHLRECSVLNGRSVELINFGVSGYNTAQELITLRKKVWAYSPDIVLLAFTTNNDVLDNSRALKRTDEIPYFVLRDGRLEIDDSFRSFPAFRLRQSFPNRAGRWVRDHIRVVQAFHQAHGAIKTAVASWRMRRSAVPPRPDAVSVNLKVGAEQMTTNAAFPDELGVDNMIYREPSEKVWQDAWLVTERLVTLMRGEVEDRGARFAVVTMSNAIQVHPDSAARTAFMRRLGVETLFYPDTRVAEMGKREGFTVINLAPELQLYAERNNLFLHGFGRELGNGHWNEHGHSVAGDLLARRLCESVLR